MSPATAHKLIREYQQLTGKTLRELTAQGAKIAAEVMAFRTAPFGKGLQARDIGRSAVRGDVARLFPKNPWSAIRKAQGEAKADEFWQVFKAWRGQSKRKRTASWGDVERVLEGTRIVPVSGSDFGKLHQSRRNKRGRVNKNGVLYFAQNQQAVERYSREVQKRVGYTKGGWAAAARQLGPSKLPSWMAGPGRGNVWSVGAKHDAKAVNLVKWVQSVQQEGAKRAANDEAQRRVLKMMSEAIRYARKKAGA